VGTGRRVLASVTSTNAEAARIAPTLMGPEWILAHEQTAGRGRRGRAWVNPPGNFMASLVMRPAEPPQQVALRSFVASLALFDAFVAATGRTEPFALKWPNDVMLNGGKVAGILLESAGMGGAGKVQAGVSHIAIGIGVNLVAAPPREIVEPGAMTPVNLLDETGTLVTPEDFLDLIAPAYAHWEHSFTTYGFAPVREAWLNRAARLGETIVARTGNAEHEGVFETVDEQGNLVLSTAKGRQVIPAADIFF